MNGDQVDDDKIRAWLQQLATPPCSEGFVERVLVRAQQGSTHQKKPAIVTVVASAIAAGCAIWFIVAGTLFSTATDPENGYRVLVSNEVQTIKVAIDSRHNLAAVHISIELSPNLTLAGFSNRTPIHWDSPLKKGVNVITLPIIGLTAGNGEIIARIQTNGKEKVLRIQTTYQAPDKIRHPVNTTTRA